MSFASVFRLEITLHRKSHLMLLAIRIAKPFFIIPNSFLSNALNEISLYAYNENGRSAKLINQAANTALRGDSAQERNDGALKFRQPATDPRQTGNDPSILTDWSNILLSGMRKGKIYARQAVRSCRAHSS